MNVHDDVGRPLDRMNISECTLSRNPECEECGNAFRFCSHLIGHQRTNNGKRL